MLKPWPLLAIFFLSACAQVPDRYSSNNSDNTVRIVRDEYGVPHVYADSIYGLYYGYGYAIAQDRLFQMEMARRSTQGTVAEVFGKDYVDYDKNARTLFSPTSIRRQINALEQEDRDIFEGYAAGFNAWLASVRANPMEWMPKQFIEHDFEPGDWSGYDVAMIFIGTMNNRYGDFNTELENAEILGSLMAQHGERAGRALFDLLNPRFTTDASTTIPIEDWSKRTYDSLAAVPARNSIIPDVHLASRTYVATGFSNCFLLGRDKVEGGGAILVNGPQFGWFNPAYVYSIGMHGAGVDVVGNSPFGYPMIMFGHNATIAWGSTWGASDIVDIFAEQLDGGDAGRYLHQGEYLDFERRTEIIAVRDGDEVVHEVWRSIHGPIIHRNDAIAYAKKRAWDGRELETLMAWLKATWAQDWEGWKAEAEKSAINVNMYFADVHGNIGYFHGGQFPRRAPGHDNRFPVAGDGSMDWRGRQDINLANPHVLNPSTGFLANWNNKPGDGVMNPDFFFYSWSTADRNDYLNEVLGATDTFTPTTAWAVLDSSSYADVYARYFLPLIDDLVQGSDDEQLVAANELLQSWNRESRDEDQDGYYDGPETAIFRSFLDSLIQRVLADDLGDVYPYFSASGYPTREQPTGAGTNISTGVKAIVESLEGGAAYDLFNGQDSSDVMRAAFTDAVEQSFDTLLPVAPRPFSTVNFLGIPQAGQDEAMMAPIEQNRGTENNMVLLRPGAIEGWEVTPPGQSGFVAPDGSRHEHYDDQFEMYQRFGKKRTWFYPDDVEASKRSEVVLTY